MPEKGKTKARERNNERKEMETEKQPATTRRTIMTFGKNTTKIRVRKMSPGTKKRGSQTLFLGCCR
jgi:hypothetical protein